MDGYNVAKTTSAITASLLAVSSGAGAHNDGCADGPGVMRDSGLMARLNEAGIPARWHAEFARDMRYRTQLDIVSDIAERLAATVHGALVCGERPVVIGGDHSCAIGTWSGVYHSLRGKGPMGLVWIDAHMDSHLPETSPSGRYHGMPLAKLMGYGDERLTGIARPGPALRPEHLCLIGIRSYEPEEALFLDKLGVRVISMLEVMERGFGSALDEAIRIATRGTEGFGVSIDLDAVDPEDAPGVGSPAPGGLSAGTLIRCMEHLGTRRMLKALEIVEFNPSLDQNGQTQQLILDLLLSVFGPETDP